MNFKKLMELLNKLLSFFARNDNIEEHTPLPQPKPEPSKPIIPESHFAPDDFKVSEINWVYHDSKFDLMSWPAVFDLNVHDNGKSITFLGKKYTDWVWYTGENGKSINGNLWVVFKYNGKWYCGCTEYLKYGNWTIENREICGAKIERDPVQEWMPEKGDTIGFIIAGLSRGGLSNVKERSNIYFKEW
jgi:hypothetical protein